MGGLRALVAVLGAVAILAGRPDAAGAGEPVLKVVASFSIIADMARQVGGARVDVVSLVPAGSDAHVFRPSPAEAEALRRADVVLVNGLGFEGYMGRLVAAAGGRASPVVVSEGVQVLLAGERCAGAVPCDDAPAPFGTVVAKATDPHAWQDPQNGVVYVGNIARAFCEADRAGCPDYKAAAARYIGEIEALDGELRAAFARLPADRRTIVTSHDAFGYLGRAYGLHVLAAEGLGTESEPTAQTVARLVRLIRNHKGVAMFGETASDPRLMAAIAAETGATVGGVLHADTLDAPGGPPTAIWR
ncbi:MAG: zinc ABC transporter substrate-binding protein [Hyphomicrobiaceae bacterium]